MASKSDMESSLNSSGLGSATKYFITVDNNNQMVNVYTGSKGHWSLIRSMRCASGTAATPTVRGLYSIYGRGPWFRAGSNTICKYWTGFYDNYLFHTILLDNNGNIQDPTLGVPASHGCVRLAIDDAWFIYDKMPTGTRVWSY
ncbi:L,D-transpeptidase [Clostridium sp. JN-9]|uniref:L,D-transpeptidase n=1 Tax=Clostridium sp. JN-9 TaxID=2507159 RepID=UPI00325B30EB